MDGDPWRDWIGRSEVSRDLIGEAPLRALSAILDRPLALETGASVPPLSNWLYFLKPAPHSEIGPDGHPRRGGFLPPVEMPRRMWAGSRCRFPGALKVGDAAEKTSTILKIEEKSGKAGRMTFVTVRHEIRVGGNVAIEEEQDIVYMPIPAQFRAPDPVAAPPGDWSERVPVDPVTLFRFSAATFNAHRIHYDRAYAQEVEKYPGLVAHGPLQAVYLLDAACRHAPARVPARFDFRGVRPLFDFDEASVSGRARDDGATDLFMANGEGAQTMNAVVRWG